MKPKGWPRPLHDETFTSWLFRSAHNKHCKTFNCEEGERYYNATTCLYELESKSDSDFDFNSTAFADFCLDHGLPNKLIRAYFRPESPFLCLPNYRFSFCPMCIREDIKIHGLPAWRKSWCYITQPICVNHKCLLTIADEFSSFYKPWDAFVTGLPRSDPQHELLMHSRRWGGMSSKLLDVNIAIKIQSWLVRLEREKWCLLPGEEEPMLSSELSHAAGVLIKIFLSSRTHFRGPGAARGLFNNGPECIVAERFSYRESMEFGSGSASPYHRMIAILMVGYVFRLFSKKDLYKLIHAAQTSGFPWLKSVEALGLHSPWFHSKDEYLDLISDFSCFTDNVRERLSPFLTGVECAAYRSKVLDSSKMKFWKEFFPFRDWSY